MEEETVQPLLKRIKSWVENSVILRIIAHHESTINFRDIIDNDRIVIDRTPVENTDIKKMVTLGVMRNLWSAIQRRSYELGTEPDPYFVLCDEFDDIASDNLDIESMLARARSMRLSVTLASQYPSQFEEETLKTMQSNCDNLLTFSVNNSDDAELLMKRFRDYTAEDLITTDQFKVWTRIPLSGGRYSEPVLIRTFPPYPPLRGTDAVDQIIEQSLETETALTERGFSVEILEQDGSEQPDAVAIHPDHDVVFNIEAETTTPDRPVKVLQNLKRAHEADRIPIFVVRPGDSQIAWARRVENILSPPLPERADGIEQFYNCDEVVTFGGGATAHGGVTAVRPRTSESNRTVWTRKNGEIVLSDGETVFARVPDEETLSKDSVPAYYSHDRETGQYTVYEAGDTQVYDSRDDFEQEWALIKQPFIPTANLPTPDYSRDSYLVLILPPADEPLVFQHDETYPLTSAPSVRESTEIVSNTTLV